MAYDRPLNTQTLFLGDFEKAVRSSLDDLRKERFGERLWLKDATLWKAAKTEQESIRGSLGWLHSPERMLADCDTIDDFVRTLQGDGFTHAVLMGMGGSSLAPLVFERSFSRHRERIHLFVLDTTDPATILALEDSIPLSDTLFICASKSGTTAEPAGFCNYFFDKVKSVKGDLAGENFAAITDPGTPLAQLAAERGFRKTFLNSADIGGRFSVLSYFGLLPAAISGIPVRELLAEAISLSKTCGGNVPEPDNPGVLLGAAMGELALLGCDKLTFLLPKSISTMGMWLEQLIAESTGKEGKGILPIDGEMASAVRHYGDDRFLVCMQFASEPDKELAGAADIVKKQGRPLAIIELHDRLSIGQEFLRWEIATATAGCILGINPFDQPNVQESKDSTNRLLAAVKERGRLPEARPVAREGALSLYGRDTALSGREMISRFFSTARRGDFVALQAYLTETKATSELIQRVRETLREKTSLATTVGYGPRFLHSTGQFHKGGPNIGLFLQLTADDAKDIPIPNAGYTFGTFKAAQAMGDMESLLRHGRRIIRIHLGPDSEKGLMALDDLIKASLSAGIRS